MKRLPESKNVSVRLSARAAAMLLVLGALLLGVAGRADEPYARSRDYDLQNARIALRFDLDQQKVIGDVTHTLAVIREGITRIAFDSVGLNISSVTLNGKPAKFETTKTQLLVELGHAAKLGEKMDVEIRYDGRPKQGLYFVLPDKNYPNRPKEIWTQGEAEDTRYYIPIYDYPNDRTSTEMIVTVPRDWETVSNGRLVNVTGAPGGMRTWHWRQSQPHSTYLISLIAGEFTLRKDTWRSIPVTDYVPRDRAERSVPTNVHTKQMLDFFSDKLGVVYPWDKFGQAWVDDFVVGGMENTSIVSNTAGALVNPQVSAESLENSDGLISHEMAHQWFGDLVTCKDWANLWLNEGFATYFATLWEEHQYGGDIAAYSLWQSRNNWMAQQRLYPVPIVTHNFTDALQLIGNFNGKAGWVLHMLRRQLGDAAFFGGLKHYLEKHRGQNVVTADLAKAIEEETGTNVDLFFDQWLYGAGAPRFEVRSAYDDAAHQVKLEVKQTQKVEGRVEIFSVPLQVEVTTAAGKKSYPIVASQASESFTFPAESQPLMVLFDKGNGILKSLDFQKSPKEWIYQLQHADAVPDRADAVRALGEIKSNEEVVAALGAAARGDAFWGVRNEGLRALARIGGPAAQQQILGVVADDKPWVRQVAVELMGAFKDDAGVAERLKTIFRDDKAYRVRGAALGAFAQQKPADGFAVLQAAAATESPDDRLRAAALRAMGTLGDDHAVPLLREWSAPGKPFPVRTAAIASLGRLDKKNSQITAQLVSYLAEPYRSLRRSTIVALGERGDPAALAPIEALIKSGELGETSRFLQGVIDRLRQAAAAEKK